MASANVVQTSVAGGNQNALALQGDGVFFPKVSTASRLALGLTTSDTGFVVYDTQVGNLFFWTGTAWVGVPTSGSPGLDQQVQFNNNGVVQGATGFTFDNVTYAVAMSSDLTVATNRLIVNSVGVSTGGSPAGNFGFTTVGKTGGIFANKNAANQYLAFQMKNSTQDYAMFIDQDGVGSNSWSIFDNTNVQTAMRYYPGAGGSWNIHQNGGVAASVTATDLDLVNRNLKVSSGKGIDFSATASGSGTMTSELLSDYEEGTFTPVLETDNVNFTSVGYSIQTGKYTKVGNLVTFTGTIYTNSVVKGSASGAVVITGLPFAQPSTDSRGGANCFSVLAWAVDSPLSGEIISSAIYLLKRATTVSGTATLTVADVSTGGANNFVRFSGQYYV